MEGDSVTESCAGELEEVAILEVVVVEALLLSDGEDVSVLRLGGILESVVCAGVVLVVYASLVEDLEAELASELEVEVEALEGDVVAPTEVHLGDCVAEVGVVLVLSLHVLRELLILASLLVLDKPHAVLREAGGVASPPLAERFAYLDTLSWAVDRLTEISLVVLVGGLVEVVAEADELIAVPSHGDCGLPGYAVLSLERSAVEGDLDASVAHLTDVGESRAVEVWRSRNVILPEHVGGVLVIEVDATAYAAFEEAEVETDVDLLADLPFEVGVRIGGDDESLFPLAVVVVVGVAEIPAGKADVAVVGDDTCHAETSTELEVGDPVGVIHEALVGDGPAERS